MYHNCVSYSSVHGCQSCFYVLAIVNCAVMNIGVLMSFGIMVFQGICPVIGLLGYMVVFLKESPYCFSWASLVSQMVKNLPTVQETGV